MQTERTKISSEEIFSYIARHSDLTKSQVKTCFKLYGKLIEEVFYSVSKPDDLFVLLPFLGRFTIKIKKGKKKGFVYRYKDLQQEKNVMAEKVVEEDEPDIEQLVFKVRANIQQNLKIKSQKVHKPK